MQRKDYERALLEWWAMGPNDYKIATHYKTTGGGAALAYFLSRRQYMALFLSESGDYLDVLPLTEPSGHLQEIMMMHRIKKLMGVIGGELVQEETSLSE